MELEQQGIRTLTNNAASSRAVGAAFLLALALPLVLGGCNTARGFGQDVEETGGAIENSAEEVQNEF